MSSFPSGHVVTADEFNATNNTAGVSAAAAADSITSTTYVNLAGSSSFSFTKRIGTGTAIRVEISASAKSTVAGDVVRFGVNINSSDADVVQGQLDASNGFYTIAGFAIVQANLAAGTYNIQGRWRRVSGSGTVSRNTSHWLAISATEVYT